MMQVYQKVNRTCDNLTIQVFWNRFLSFVSCSNGGTLFMQLTEEMWWVQQQQKQTTTTTTNKQTKTNNMNACEDFFLDVTDAHIWAAFMAEYGMSSLMK